MVKHFTSFAVVISVLGMSLQSVNAATSTYPIATNANSWQSNTDSLSSSVGNRAAPSFVLPDLSGGGERFDERNQHKLLGEWSIRQINKEARLLDDAWSQQQLEALAWRINAQARAQAPLALAVLNSKSINAFAIPGGVMGLNTGTVTAANSIDELASVIAHEVAHISQRHYEHNADTDRKALLLQVGGLLAALAAASASADGDATAAIMMGSQTAALNSQMAYSRSNEREADRIGMQLMSKAGYDPTAMPRFFATLNDYVQLNSNPNGFLPSYIMSHPLSSERLSEAQSRANAYRAQIKGINFIDKGVKEQRFALLKWRIKLLTQQTTETELKAAASNNIGAGLALAYWYAKEGQYHNAQRLLSRLQQQINASSNSDSVKGLAHSEANILLAVTQAQVAGLQNHWQQSKKILQPLHQLYPERRDLRLYLADVELQLENDENAQQLLRPLIEQRPFDLAALDAMQRSYTIRAKNLLSPSYHANTNNSAAPSSQQRRELREVAGIQALRYRAQVELWQGLYTEALTSLKQAEKNAESLVAKRATINVKPLLTSIKRERNDIKIAEDFKP